MKKLLFLIIFIPNFLSSQIIEDFSDTNFINNPTWHGDTSKFEIVNPETSGNGSINPEANNDDLVLRSKQFQNDAAMLIESNMAIGEWRFALADGRGWAVSSTNDYKIILISDDSTRANLYQGNHNFNGYYLQLDGGNSDNYTLYKQTGTTSTELINCEYPVGDDGSVPVARTIKVTRDNLNLWKIFIDEGFEIDPATQRGTSVVDADHSTSSYFGIVTNISSASDTRTLYFDNLYIGDIITDTVAPFIDSIEVINQNELYLYFNEPVDQYTAENTANYTVNNSVGSPNIAILDGDTLSLVKLTFANSFPDATECTISIINVEDLEGNAIVLEQANFTYIPQIIAEYNDVIINEIFADPSPQVGLPQGEFVEIYNTSSKTFNLSNWILTDQSTNAALPQYALNPGEYIILCANSDTLEYSSFGNTLGVSNWPSLNNSGDNLYLKDNSSNIIDSVFYDVSWYHDPEKAEGGWTLELINPEANSNCPIWQNWIASNDTQGGTPGTVNSVYSIEPDTENPEITSVSVSDSVTLIISFSEALFEPTIAINSNYTINNGIGQPTNVSVNETLNEIVLTLSTPLTENFQYTITCSNLSDCSGNPLLPNTAQFTYTVASFKDLIINEIFADPSPQVGLPTVEFIEIYNRTDASVNVSNWRFTDGSTTGYFPDIQIESNAYAILCLDEDTSLFSANENVIGLTSFPSLNNAGENIILLDNSNIPIDSVHYLSTWYNDPDKEDGGWTLELINPEFEGSCPVSSNWSASVNSSGGTPGTQNSIYSIEPDTQAPEVLSVQILASDSILVTFNEAMDATSLQTTTNYSVDNSIGNPVSIEINESLNTALLIFANSLQEGETYTITVSNISDCSGNLMTDFSTEIILSIPAFKDVIVNEIFADPSPQVALPAGEFIEIFNISSKPFDLSGWELGFNTTRKSLSGYNLHPNSFLIICDDEYESDFNVYGDVLALESFPSLTNSGGTVYLFDNNGNMIDSISYDESFYKDSNKEDGGWSLELINPNPNRNCPDYNNWAASVNENGGTPGQINSIFNNATDTVAPTAKAISVLNELQLLIEFSEALDAAAISNPLNYSVNNGLGYPMAVEPNNNLNNVVITFATPIQQEITYYLEVSNLMDCSENEINPASYSFVFYLPQIYDVVINEIMSDPTPNVALPEGDYIELYNRTSFPINLNGWTLAIGNTIKEIESNIFIQGNDFILLCDDDEETQFSNYGNLYSFSSFSLSDESGTLVLRDNGYNLIHFVNYSEDWFDLEGKKEGGWSLEQNDPTNPCGEDMNWSGSQDVDGGTPNRINSVFAENPDNDSPELLRISYLDSLSILVYFSEILDSIPIRNVAAYQVDNNIGNPINVIPIFPDYSSVILEFETIFEEGITYTLTVTDSIKDCVGNNIASNTSAIFAVPQTPEENDIIINEILTDPKENGVDFVELYNNSTKVIDLKHLRLASFDEIEQKPKDMKKIAEDGWLVFPMEYYVLSTNSVAVKKQYYTKNPEAFIEMESFPSFANDEGNVILAKIDSTYIDHVPYNSDMHFQLLTSTDGVSLERLSVERSSTDETNWLSASETVGYATPGYLNSQYSEINGFEGEITIEPEIFSPDNDGYNDVLNIGYSFSDPGYSMTIKIYNSKGREMKALVSNLYLGTKSGVVSWDGITDDNEKASIGIYLVYVEAFDLSGNVKHFKKTAVLGTKL